MTEEQKAELHHLEKLTIVKLREEAKEKYHDQIKGVHGMNKGQLIKALCEQEGIPYEEEKRRVALGINKAAFKRQISQLKAHLQESGKSKQERSILRKRVKRLKRKLRHAV
jgi:hypothetical protein